MPQLRISIALATLLGLVAPAQAGLGPTSRSPAAQEAATAQDQQLARRKKTKKKPAKKPAVVAEPAKEPEPPPAEKPKTEATEAAAPATDWGSPDWASPTGSTSTSSASSADRLLGSEPAKVEKIEEPSKTSRYKRAAGLGGAALILRPGYTGAGRNYAYADPRTPNLRPYKAMFISMVGGSGELYPAVWAGLSIVDDIGLRGGYWQAIGLKSSTGGGDTDYTTTFSAMDVGLTGRFHLGDSLLSLNVSYGTLTFDLAVPASDPLAEQVQNLAYGFLRAGLDFRLVLDRLAILAGGAYRHVLSTGPLGDDFFPSSSALGFDAHLGAAYELLGFLELYGRGNFVQFIHSFDPRDGAAYAADGATDLYWGAELGVAVFF